MRVMLALLQTAPETTTPAPESAPEVRLSADQFDALLAHVDGAGYFLAGVLCVLVVGIGGLLFVSMMGGR